MSLSRLLNTAFISTLLISGDLATPALAGAMATIADLGNRRVYGLDNAGNVLAEDGLYRDGVRTALPPGASGYFMAISPGGTIASTKSGWNQYNTFVWKDGREYDTGETPHYALVGGGPYSRPYAVNDAGAVAGDSHAYGRWNRAFVSAVDYTGAYRPDSLGANGGTTSLANGINKNGVVVGHSDVAGQWRNHAFVGRPENDIGTLGGANSSAQDINDKNQVIGWSTVAHSDSYSNPGMIQGYNDPGDAHAFLYSGSSGMTDLGTLPGWSQSAANAINESGQIVGTAANHRPNFDSAVSRAVLFDAAGGTPTDLNDLIPVDLGWVLQSALHINDTGQILGYGSYQGERRAYLLTLSPTPTPEPGTIALFGLTCAWLASRHYRRRARA